MKPPILWIHGWGMSADIWALSPEFKHFDLLPEYDHHYVSFAACNKMEDFQQAILNELDTSSGAWILIGWSMGGMLALETVFHEEYRKRYNINAVIIISSTLQFINTDRQLGWPLRVVEKMKKKVAVKHQEALRDFRQLMFSSTDREHKDLTDFFNECAEGKLKQEYTLAGLEAGLDYLVKTDLRETWLQFVNDENKTNLPALFWIHGSSDLICPCDASPDLPIKQKIIIHHAGHMPFFTESRRFYDSIRGLLHVRKLK